MAPIKFEEQLKEKLEKRTIQPSQEVWETLSDRLDQQGRKQNHKTYWWLGIAASLVGIILVSTLIFDNSEVKISEPTVVDINENQDLKTNAVVSEIVKVQKEENKDVINSEMKSINGEKPKAKVTKSSEIVSPEKESIKKAIVKDAVASNDMKEEEHTQTDLETPLNNSDFENAKLNDVVAEINRLNVANNGVSEAEIDSLLKHAERDILTNRIYNEKTRTVDANALLQDVEADLEQSFRTRVYEALKSSYVTVKTAVAERNN